jgi:hypothetical protein
MGNKMSEAMNHQVKPFTSGQECNGYGTERCNGMDDVPWPVIKEAVEAKKQQAMEPVQSPGVERDKAVNGCVCDRSEIR